MPGKRKTPALTAAAREQRDRLILDLFLAGKPKPDIASHPQVKLTVQRIDQIINTELERATRDQVVLNEKALTIYHARLEILVQEAFSHVQGGDLKAIEVARRLLDQQQKLFGLTDDNRPMPIAPMSDTELSDLDDGEQMDELAKYRSQRSAPPPAAKEAEAE